MNRNTKTKRKQFSTVSKENEEKNSSESHIELDSRLLSALLTVSIDIFCPCRGERKAKCFTLTGLFNTFDILKFCAFRFVSLEVSNLCFSFQFYRESIEHFHMFQVMRLMTLLRSKHQCSSNW